MEVVNLPHVADRLRGVDPDLSAVPLYFVPASRWQLGGVDSLAFYSPLLADRLRDRLVAGGLWAGEGAVVAVNESLLSQTVDDTQLYSRVWGACVHEVGHVLDIPTAGEFARRTAGDDAWGCRYHGLRWVRACCHLLHRLRLCNVDPRDVQMTAGAYGCTGSPFRYLEVTECEARRCREWPIRRVLRTDPSDSLLAVWREDVARRLGVGAGAVSEEEMVRRYHGEVAGSAR